LDISFSYWFKGIRICYIFYEVYAVCIKDGAGKGDCGSGVFIAVKADG
jgi:hypothetical protein